LAGVERTAGPLPSAPSPSCEPVPEPAPPPAPPPEPEEGASCVSAVASACSAGGIASLGSGGGAGGSGGSTATSGGGSVAGSTGLGFVSDGWTSDPRALTRIVNPEALPPPSPPPPLPPARPTATYAAAAKRPACSANEVPRHSGSDRQRVVLGFVIR